jgi:ribosomal protein S18 acetylase RimI-like enzyme
MEELVIEAFQPQDLVESAGVLAAAMCPNPIHMAVFDWDHEKERELQIGFFKAALGQLQGGTIVGRQAGRVTGVLCSARSPGCRMTPSRAQQLIPILRDMFGDRTPRIMEWRSAWGKHDPDADHWHLGPFGVLPELQNRGIGSRLLDCFLKSVDEMDEAVYLETDKADNIRLYQRFGFAALGDQGQGGERRVQGVELHPGCR